MTKEILNHEPYTIQPTTSADVESLNAMHSKSWRETYPNEEAGVSREWVEERVAARALPEAIEGRKKFIDDNRDNPAMISLVAKGEDGEVIGMAHGYRDEEGRQHLGSLYVAREFHGTGVAQDLIAKVIAWSDPTEPMYVGVASYNQRAQAFYAKNGFIPIEGSDRLFADKIPEIEMIRKGDAQQ